MSVELTWTITAPYRRCTACQHPGPPEQAAGMTIAQPFGAREFDLIPHYADCLAPNPFAGPSVTIMFNDQSEVRRG